MPPPIFGSTSGSSAVRCDSGCASTYASHSPIVTSFFAIANAPVARRCSGTVDRKPRVSSSAALPNRNAPAGT
jgi:hypothetical protein